MVCKTAVCAERLYQHCINSNNNHVEAQVVACNSYMDLIAREFRYHRSCYKKLCRPSKENSVEEQPQKVKRQDCIDKLKEYVNELVIRNGQIIRVSDIAKRYVRLQEESDISSGSCETRMVKSLLINVFGDKISFVQKKIGTAEFVFATENDNNDRNEQNLMFMTDVEKVKKIAAMIKNEITTFYDDNPIFSDWPPPEDEIKADRITLPPLLSSLISTLLTNEGSNSSRCTRLVRSLSQDVIYACSRGKLKTVKHTQLGLITKRKTGSKFLINCLNRLGHCLNYDDINKLETSFAEKQAIHVGTRSFLPNNVQPSTFVTFVYDNCDHNPETLSGATMHFTNGIIIQRSSNNDGTTHDNIQPRPAISRRKSFRPIINEIQPYYAPKERLNPATVNEFEIDSDLMLELLSRKADIIWVLSRLRCLQDYDKQIVPNWTGFYFEVIQRSDDVKPHTVCYLPAINQTPTRLDTVQEVLLQVKEKSEALLLPSADLVLDHAIYSKALDVLTNPQHDDLRKFINLRMGGFHACGIFIAVIGKRFSAAGLKDILIESDLIGPSAIESVLKGKAN